jgi:hypothetical protein
MIEAWRKAWRDGIAPQLSAAALEALARALESDDPQLLQGATTSPPPLQSLQDAPVEAACPLALAAWKGDGLRTVGEVEEAFARLCMETDLALGEPAAVRYFLNAWDDGDRGTMRAELLTEVRGELARRNEPAAA